MIFITGDEAKSLAPMGEVIKACHKVFIKHAQGKTVYPPKDQFMLPTSEWKWWGFMPVYAEGMGVACKVVCDYPENKKRGLPTIIATINLADVDTGNVIAIIEATQLTAIRTGALCALAADALSRKDAETVGIIGCGVQARTQLEGLAQVRKIKKTVISDLNEERMDAFISDMSFLGILISKGTPKDAASCDILVTATGASTPVIKSEWIKPGTHITSIGAHTPDTSEIGSDLVTSSIVVIDTPDCFKSGDLKTCKVGDITEIQEVLSGKAPGRKSESDVTIFKSVGTALQDLAIARLVYDKAKEEGIGKEIDF